MAIASDRIEAVRAMRAAGLSQAAAGAAAGLSRRKVQQIEARARDEGWPAADPQSDPEFARKPTRCLICGAMVVPPCRACHTRAVADATAAPGPAAGDDLHLALLPADRARYLEVTRAAATDAVFGDHCPESWLTGDGLPEPSDEVLRDIASRNR